MIHFGRGKAAEAVDALGGPGYTLLTTERAASAAPWIAMAASAVHQVPVPAFLRRKEKPYDLVILDPPYADPAIGTMLEMLGDSQLVESGTIVALGHWPKFDSDSVSGTLRLIKRRCHGDSCFSIYEVARGTATPERRPQSIPAASTRSRWAIST